MLRYFITAIPIILIGIDENTRELMGVNRYENRHRAGIRMNQLMGWLGVAIRNAFGLHKADSPLLSDCGLGIPQTTPAGLSFGPYGDGYRQANPEPVIVYRFWARGGSNGEN
ncbi:hypothetical protein BJL95_04435 [Methylomonas sp. LWB]|nr:hypothetical protein BJL95_04435 [Methylomonas sp. LWB]